MSKEKTEKKKFPDNSPEWQLFQNMMSNKLLVSSHMKDAERHTALAEAARTKYEAYKEALCKLEPNFNEDTYS